MQTDVQIAQSVHIKHIDQIAEKWVFPLIN